MHVHIVEQRQNSVRYNFLRKISAKLESQTYKELAGVHGLPFIRIFAPLPPHRMSETHSPNDCSPRHFRLARKGCTSSPFT